MKYFVIYKIIIKDGKKVLVIKKVVQNTLS